MAHSADDHLERIHLLKLLSSDERRRCLFLCGTSDLDQTVPCLAEFLVERSNNPDQFWAEMFMQLGRFDILRHEFGIGRDQVAKLLTNGAVLSKFRVLMDSISEDLDENSLENLKFLFSGMLHHKTTKSKSFLDIVVELEKLDKVSPEKVDLIEDFLRDIHRKDLARRVEDYKLSVNPPAQCAPEQKSYRVTSPIPESSVQQRRCEPFQTSGLCLISATNSLQASVSRDRHSQSPLDRYRFKTNPRGVCLIIDCVGKDGEMLERTFMSLHFRVELHKWLTVDGALSALEKFSIITNLEGDGSICCIISRGTADHLLGTDTCSTDLSLERIKHHLSADVCPEMVGKPKMFFIQRYGVSEYSRTPQLGDEELEIDGPSIPKDVFWSHCWTDEQQLQGEHHSSIYLKELTNAIEKGSVRGEHLVDVHQDVTRLIDNHNSMNPDDQYHIDHKHTLTKNLYL